mgnify:CR=1 FL=1
MYRTLQYALLFLVAALLQIFLFNNLSLSVYLNPLVYVVFIALLPMETTPIRMLLAGLAMGLAMDWTMGAAGVNTIATVFVATFSTSSAARRTSTTAVCPRHGGWAKSPSRSTSP